MKKAILILLATAMLWACATAEEDIAGYWLDKGNESFEQALNGTQNDTTIDLLLQEALDAYNKTLEIEPQSVPGWQKKGEVLFELERHEESISCINRSTEIAPQSASTWYLKACILGELGRWQEALEAFSSTENSLYRLFRVFWHPVLATKVKADRSIYRSTRSRKWCSPRTPAGAAPAAWSGS